jgi:predicted GNAT family N-acyltransferase
MRDKNIVTQPVHCKRVESIPEFIDAIRLRVDVFILEQKCQPGWEPDELDKDSEHYIALIDKKIVGTLRVREEVAGEFKIERMVTDNSERGKGIGKSLLSYVVSLLRQRPASRIWMQAQDHARPFYNQVGFETTSPVYDLWGIPHVDMEFGSLASV